jgi:hypothetical protein
LSNGVRPGGSDTRARGDDGVRPLALDLVIYLDVAARGLTPFEEGGDKSYRFIMYVDGG